MIADDCEEEFQDFEPIEPVVIDSSAKNLISFIKTRNNQLIFFERKKAILFGVSNNKIINDLFLNPYMDDCCNISFTLNNNVERFVKQSRSKARCIDETFECTPVSMFNNEYCTILKVSHLLFFIEYYLKVRKYNFKSKSKRQKPLVCTLIKNNNSLRVLSGTCFYLPKTSYISLIDDTINQHIVYSVTRYSFISKGRLLDKNIQTKTLKTNKRNLTNYARIISFFDTETIDFKDYHVPYALSCVTFVEQRAYEFDTYQERVFTTKYPLEPDEDVVLNYLNYLIDEYGDHFEWIHTIQLIGFNNNRFDNNFLYQKFDQITRFSKPRIFCNSRNNKISNTTITFYFRGYPCVIIIKDMVTWIPDCSLSTACKSYEIEDAKINFNIVKYNEYSKTLAEQQHNQKLADYVDEKTFFSFFDNLTFSAKKELKQRKNNAGYYDAFDFMTLYCLYDTKSLYELYFKIKKSVLDLIENVKENVSYRLPSENFMDYLGVPEFAGYVFRLYYNEQGEKKLTFFDSTHAQIIYSTYFGGRVNYGCIGDYKSSNLVYMDVVSEYPLAMTGYYPSITDRGDFIVGYDIDIEKIQKIVDEMQNTREIYKKNNKLNCYDYMARFDTFAGIFFCKIEQPEDKSNLICFAAIPSREKGLSKLIYTHELRPRFLNTNQFRNLILSGYKITICKHEYNIHFLNMKQIFNTFIQDLGKIKAKAKAFGNTALAKMTKLIANTIAGKLAQKPSHVISQVVYKQHACYRETFDEADWSRSMHYLATFITASANWILYSKMYELELKYIYAKQPMNNRGGLLYADTDSIIFNPTVCSEVEFSISDDLGDYSLEKGTWNTTWSKHYGGINRIIIIAKKSYILLKDNTIIEYKLKGIHKEKVYLFSLQDLINIIFGIPKQIEFDHLQRSFKQPNASDITNDGKALEQVISVARVKKTLSREKHYKKLIIDNEQIIELNHDQLAKKQNFLEFVTA